MPPWNAQHIFNPAALPQLVDPTTIGEEVAPEDTPVKNRFYPEYAARGIREGDWMFHPSLGAGAFYDSNVFSSPSGQQGDVATVLGASLAGSSLWERHGINVQLSTVSTLYSNHSGLNQTDATFTSSGHYDIDHSTQLLGLFNVGFLHEGVGSLTSPTGAVQPTPFSIVSGDLTLRKELGRFTTSVGGRVDSYNFGSTVAQNGSIITQDSRDGPIYTGHSRVDYAFSEKSAVFTSVEGNWRDLRGTPTQSLKSYGYRALAGFDLEFTHLIKGEIAAGYQRQHFFASSIGDIEGPTYRVMLVWSPSRKVDVHFNAEQIVTDASDTSATGILASAAQLGLDYEFRPNVVVSTTATYENDRFQGQPRDDNVYAAGAQIKYALNNVLSLSLRYAFTRRDSNDPAAIFSKHVVGLNASAHF